MVMIPSQAVFFVILALIALATFPRLRPMIAPLLFVLGLVSLTLPGGALYHP